MMSKYWSRIVDEQDVSGSMMADSAGRSDHMVGSSSAQRRRLERTGSDNRSSARRPGNWTERCTTLPDRSFRSSRLLSRHVLRLGMALVASGCSGQRARTAGLLDALHDESDVRILFEPGSEVVFHRIRYDAEDVCVYDGSKNTFHFTFVCDGDVFGTYSSELQSVGHGAWVRIQLPDNDFIGDICLWAPERCSAKIDAQDRSYRYRLSEIEVQGLWRMECRL